MKPFLLAQRSGLAAVGSVEVVCSGDLTPAERSSIEPTMNSIVIMKLAFKVGKIILRFLITVPKK